MVEGNGALSTSAVTPKQCLLLPEQGERCVAERRARHQIGLLLLTCLFSHLVQPFPVFLACRMVHSRCIFAVDCGCDGHGRCAAYFPLLIPEAPGGNSCGAGEYIWNITTILTVLSAMFKTRAKSSQRIKEWKQRSQTLLYRDSSSVNNQILSFVCQNYESEVIASSTLMLKRCWNVATLPVSNETDWPTNGHCIIWHDESNICVSYHTKSSFCPPLISEIPQNSLGPTPCWGRPHGGRHRQSLAPRQIHARGEKLQTATDASSYGRKGQQGRRQEDQHGQRARHGVQQRKSSAEAGG